MSLLSQKILLPNNHEPVMVLQEHMLSPHVWLFTTPTFRVSPWVNLYRQSLHDDELENFLVDSYRFREDGVDLFLRRLYREMGLDPDSVSDNYDNPRRISWIALRTRPIFRLGKIKNAVIVGSLAEFLSFFQAENRAVL